MTGFGPPPKSLAHAKKSLVRKLRYFAETTASRITLKAVEASLEKRCDPKVVMVRSSWSFRLTVSEATRRLASLR
jgi:hypothetical protein